MTKLIGTELIGFTVTDGTIAGRVIDYYDGIYYVTARDCENVKEFTRKQITVVHQFGGKVA